MQKKPAATNKKKSAVYSLPNRQTRFFYKENSSEPLTLKEEKAFKKEVKEHFEKTVVPLRDDEFMLKFKHFYATMKTKAAMDPLSTLDVFRLSEHLFNNEFIRRGLKKPVATKEDLLANKY
ncbi:MAG: hypothetical protein OQJ93_09420 [Ignavibacteriaceae bacterium]|nr:hypothetical protein [Ignavibacteriaceae bacterium]